MCSPSSVLLSLLLLLLTPLLASSTSDNLPLSLSETISFHKTALGSRFLQNEHISQPAETTDEPIMPPGDDFDEPDDYDSAEPQVETQNYTTTKSNNDSESAKPINDSSIVQVEYATSQKEFWLSVGIVVGLVCFTGLMSGLTIGYLSINEVELENKLMNGTDDEKHHAAVVMPIVAKNYQLLSTLLILNAIAQEAIPVFLENITSTWLAVIISALLIITFGEILPQICCTESNQLKIASKMSSFVKILMIVCFISAPIAYLLQQFLGARMKSKVIKNDLKSLIELQEVKMNHKESSHATKQSFHNNIQERQLTADEVKKVNSTIDLKDSPIINKMKPIDQVFTLSSVTKINKDMVKKVAKLGHSNIPIYENYEKNKIIGILKAKTLLDYQDNWEGQTIAEAGIQLIDPLIVSMDISMLELLMLFEDRKVTMALVSSNTIKAKVKNAIFFSRRNLILETNTSPLTGLITLKDIFQELSKRKFEMEDAYESSPTLSRNSRSKYEIGESPEKLKNPLLKPLLK